MLIVNLFLIAFLLIASTPAISTTTEHVPVVKATADSSRGVQTVFLSEDFGLGWPPAGWTQIDTYDGLLDNCNWHYESSGGYNGGGHAAVDEPLLLGAVQDEVLISPPLDFGAKITNLELEFAYYLDFGLMTSAWQFQCRVSVDGGNSWDVIWEANESTGQDENVWYLVQLPLDAYVGSEDVLISWRDYHAAWQDGVGVWLDAVTVTGEVWYTGLTTVAPQNNEIAVPVSSIVSAEFDSTLLSSTVDTQSVRLYSDLYGPVGGSVTYDDNLRRITLEPSTDLRAGDKLTATITSDIWTSFGKQFWPHVWQFTTATNPSQAEFAPAPLPDGPETPEAIAFADFDSDGDLDYVLTSGSENALLFYSQSSPGQFDYQMTLGLTSGSYPNFVEVADFDLDGNMDVISSASYSFVVLSGDGDFTFSDTAYYTPGSSIYGPEVADFDGNGYPDVIFPNATGPYLQLYMNNGTGHLSFISDLTGPTFPIDIASGDFDGDGDIDIAVANHFDSWITVHFNDGTGTFLYPYDQYTSSRAPYSIVTTDLNGDHNLDLICGHGSSAASDTVSYMLGDGNGNFAPYEVVVAGKSPLFVEVGDMDGDGDMDVVSSNANDSSVTVLLNDGTGNLRYGRKMPAGLTPMGIAVADVDGDGDLDVVAANRDSDDLTLLINRPMPSVAQVEPLQNTSVADPYSAIVATIDSPLDEMTIVDSTLVVHTKLQGRVQGSLGVLNTVDSAYLHFSPYEPFLPGDHIDVTICPGIMSQDGISLEPFYWSFDIGVSEGMPDFSNRTFRSTSSYVWKTLIADVDNDSGLDILAFMSDRVEILHNGGDVWDTVIIDPQIGPISMADLNRDGALDIVSFSDDYQDSTYVYVNDGSGEFSLGAVGPGGIWCYPDRALLADFGMDGWFDLIFSCSYSHGAALYEGSSALVFSPWEEDVSYGSYTCGDFDLDGSIDYAVRGYNALEFYINRGEGDFEHRVFAIDGNDDFVAVSDLDGNGTLDVICPASGWRVASLLLDSSGQIVDSFFVDNPVFANKALLGDLSGDGYPDLVLAGSTPGSISIHRSNGDGSFAPGEILELWPYLTSIALGDMDGNGTTDIVAASSVDQSLAILYNLDAPDVDGHSPASVKQNVQPEQYITATFDQHLYSETVNSTTCLLNSPTTGQITGDVTYNDGLRQIYVVPDSPLPLGEQLTVTLTDSVTAGSGAKLLGGYQWSFTTVVNDSTGNFAMPTLMASNNGTHSIVSFDADGDGDLDLAAANAFDFSISVFINQGSSGFASAVRYEIGDTVYSLVACDLDNDGPIDLAACRAHDNQVSILINDGEGAFAMSSAEPVTGSFPFNIQSADINGDGEQDLVTANSRTDNISVMLNDGDGTAFTTTNYSVGDDPWSVLVTDMNGDGKLDLVSANKASNDVSVLLNHGNGTFGQSTEYPCGSYCRSICAVDFDGDHFPDIVAANADADSLAVLYNDGLGGLELPVYFATGDRPVYVAAGDIDGDGDQDIVSANDLGDEIAIHWNDGTGVLSEGENTSVYSAGNGPHCVSLADLDRDGDLDIAVAILNSDSIAVFENHTMATEFWYVATTGNDTTGDGSEMLPYGTIQHAIDQSKEGDWILVGAGTYSGSGNVNIDLGSRNLSIKSLSGPDLTIIDCDASGEDCDKGFLFQGEQNSTTVLDGFTIVDGCGGAPDYTGGAILCDGASPTIINCVMAGGRATVGCGAACRNGSNPLIQYCTFVDCGYDTNDDVISCLNGSFPTINNCLIAFSGDPLMTDGTAPTLSCCDLYGNAAGDWTGSLSGQLGLNDNISADPKFCEEVGIYLSTYTVAKYSPCLPDWNGCGDRIGALGQGCDVGFEEIRLIYPAPNGEAWFYWEEEYTYVNTASWVKGDGVGDVTIQLSRDGGNTWDAESEPISGSSTEWASAERTETFIALMRATAVNDPGTYDVIDGYFSIKGRNVSTSTSGYLGKIMHDTDPGTVPDIPFIKGGRAADGISDFVQATRIGEVWLHQGLGDGTFDSLGAKVITTDSGLVDLGVSDINHDGFPDIVLANELTTEVLVFEGMGGTAFSDTPIVTLDLPGAPVEFGLCSFNNDNQVDIWVCHGLPDGISVFMGAATGGFEYLPSYSLSLSSTPVAGLHHYVDSNDLLDMSIVYGPEGHLVHLVGDGTGQFDVLIDTAVVDEACGIVSGDFDLNGYTDVGIISASPDGRFVAVCQGDSGNFFFDEYPTVYGNHTAVVTNDFTGDGMLDVLIATDDIDSLIILGGISPSPTNEKLFGLPVLTEAGSGPFEMVSADLDYDGNPDVLTINSVSNDVVIVTTMHDPLEDVSISVVSPNGGESYSEGETVSVEFTKGEGIVAVDLWLSIDGGSSWTLVAPGLVDDSYDWAVWDVSTNQALFQVVDFTVATRNDRSDGYFSIAGTNCCMVSGDINNSGSGPDIADLVFLVEFMFQGGTEPECLDACDPNGDGSSVPDISDLVYIVSYMFQGGSAPVPCY